MIIDSSAILTIVNQEPRYEAVAYQLAAASETYVGAPTRVEAGLVLTGRFGLSGRTILERFLQRASVVTIPFDDNHAEVALDAFQRFGKGRHPASLNFGDCLTYAVAYVTGYPLLCIGDDFPRTDLLLVDA